MGGEGEFRIAGSESVAEIEVFTRIPSLSISFDSTFQNREILR